MDLSLHACQGCPIAISNKVVNQDWLVLVSLTRWRTNRKIISVSNRPVSWYPMPQGAPVSPTLVRQKAKFSQLSHVSELTGNS